MEKKQMYAAVAAIVIIVAVVAVAVWYMGNDNGGSNLTKRLREHSMRLESHTTSTADGSSPSAITSLPTTIVLEHMFIQRIRLRMHMLGISEQVLFLVKSTPTSSTSHTQSMSTISRQRRQIITSIL